MPKPTVRARPEAKVAVQVNLPGELKNRILDAAQTAGMSLNAWLTNAIYQQLHHGDSRPEPKAMPTPHEVIADYLAGRQTVAPCGKPFPCEGADQIEMLNGLEFCAVCHVRVK